MCHSLHSFNPSSRPAPPELIHPHPNTSVFSLPPPCALASLCECALLADALDARGHKRTVCLSAPSRSLTFYGAVSQAWPGNSCGAPSRCRGPCQSAEPQANVTRLLMRRSTAAEPPHPCGVQSVVTL